MYKTIIKNRKVFSLQDIKKAISNKKNDIIRAVLLFNLSDAIGLNFFFGWALSDL